MNAVVRPSMGAQTLERLRRDFESSLPGLPATVLSPVARRRAAERLENAGWPSVREEQWRHAGLKAFERIASFAPAAPAADAARKAAARLPAPLPGFERHVFVDGVRLTGEAAAVNDAGDAGPAQWSPAQRLGWLTEMFAADAAVLRVRGSAAIELAFLVSGQAAGRAVYPRLQVRLEPGAQLTLVERHLGDVAALVAAATTLDIGAGARLTHYRLQQYGPAVACSDSLAARLGPDAAYRMRQVSLGAGSARTSAGVQLEGTGADASWQAIAIGRADQVLDTTLELVHAARATRSDVAYRGIADERARLAFHGHVQINGNAAGAQAVQSLRGLIEGRSAELDLRPRLQIDVDEVNARHGATTGRLDEQLLFYLLSRGLDPAAARALLKWAFLEDVLRLIELAPLRTEAERAAAGLMPEAQVLSAANGADA